MSGGRYETWLRAMKIKEKDSSFGSLRKKEVKAFVFKLYESISTDSSACYCRICCCMYVVFWGEIYMYLGTSYEVPIPLHNCFKPTLKRGRLAIGIFVNYSLTELHLCLEGHATHALLELTPLVIGTPLSNPCE